MDLSVAKHAFVTGGASGLGLGIVDAMRLRGVKVTVADVDSERLANIVAERGEDVRGVVFDTRDRDGWVKAKTEAESAFGPVDILINNAGIAPDGRQFADMDPDSFDRIVGINLTGVANGIFAFAADMRERGGGHIVNTSSQAGLSANVPGAGAYIVAKFGVTALSEALRVEMEPHGVGVSVLCPGYVSTNLGETTQKMGGDMRGKSVIMPPSQITAEQVAELVVEAITENAPYIITHGNVWKNVEPRFEAIRTASQKRDASLAQESAS